MRRHGIFFHRICATTATGATCVVVVILFFFLVTSTSVVDGFASFLVETKMGCMTDLSIEEVIMNNEVKSPEESDFPKMHLVVLDANENHMETPYHYDPSSSLSSSGSITITIAFVNPYSIQEFREDLQFVMEVEGPAEFIDGGAIGCEGNSRISGYNNDAVVLKVNDPTAKLKVWGGWATGHSSVRLIPDLILEPGVIISSTTTTNGEEKIKMKKEEVVEKEENPEIINPKKEEEIIREGDTIHADEDQPELEQLVDRPEKEKHKQKKKNVLDKFLNTMPKGLEDIMDKKGVVNGDGKDFKQEIILNNKDRVASLSGDNRNIKQKIKDKHAGLTQLDNRKEREKVRHNNNNNNNKNNMPKDADGKDDDIGGGDDDEITIRTANNKKDRNILPVNSKVKNHNFKNEFDISRHMVACGFFAFSIGLIVMVFGKRRGDKGRRDL